MYMQATRCAYPRGYRVIRAAHLQCTFALCRQGAPFDAALLTDWMLPIVWHLGQPIPVMQVLYFYG